MLSEVRHRSNITQFRETHRMALRLPRTTLSMLIDIAFLLCNPSSRQLIFLGATRLRPSAPIRNLPVVTLQLRSSRQASNVPAEDPKKRAQSIIDALPGGSLISKTAILSAGTGVSIWAISNELYVVNEETVVAFSLLSVFYGIFRYGGPMYKEWADTQIQKIKDIMYAARAGHADAVKARIEDVKPLSNVVEITKQLFEVSKVCPGGVAGADNRC